MARVLITGSTGLIGRWVLAHLPKTLEPVQVSHSDIDLTEPDAFVGVIRAARPATVLHLAWSASGTPGYRNATSNERWTKASYDAATYCLGVGIRFVGTGTVVDRDRSDAYARSKSELRDLLSPLIDEGSITWVRPYYTFDPALGRPRLVADARDAIVAGRPVELGSPNARHDFIHASDVGTAIGAILDHDLSGSIDVGSGHLRSVAELAVACGAEVRTTTEDVPIGDGDVADTSRLLELGWRPWATEEFFAGGPSAPPRGRSTR